MPASNVERTKIAVDFDRPKSFAQAIWRGMRNRCARCDHKTLFARYLKPILICKHCGQDWTPQQAHDFPAYLSILITGHLMAPIIIAIASSSALPLWGNVIIAMIAACALLLLLLQPLKGAVIAAQWWLGMHGFDPQRS